MKGGNYWGGHDVDMFPIEKRTYADPSSFAFRPPYKPREPDPYINSRIYILSYDEALQELKTIILNLGSEKYPINRDTKSRVVLLLNRLTKESQNNSVNTGTNYKFLEDINKPIKDGKGLRSIIETQMESEQDETKKQLLKCIKRLLLIAGAYPKTKYGIIVDRNDKVPPIKWTKDGMYELNRHLTEFAKSSDCGEVAKTGGRRRNKSSKTRKYKVKKSKTKRTRRNYL